MILYVAAAVCTAVYIDLTFEWSEGEAPRARDVIAAIIWSLFACLLWPVFWTSQLLTEQA